jgi:hypothetical protein
VKTFPAIKPDPLQLATLRVLWETSERWFGAANGRSPFYPGKVERTMARDAARQALEKYFAAIDQIVLDHHEARS